MKLLLAMLSKGQNIPEFFPDVVKNIVAKSIGESMDLVLT
jgi:vesicle coat complex subunit